MTLKNESKGTLMVMAGGTGGHVYPAIAVADYLYTKGWKIVWLATEGGMENRLIADKPYSKAMMTMRGVRGKGLMGWVLLPFKLMLSYVANKVLAAFPAAFGDKATLVGNPVRDDITTLALPEKRYAEKTGKLKLLVVGGSLGAAALNDVLPKALATIREAQRPEVVHQAGEKHIATLEANYQQAGVKAETKAYIQDMASMYAWADVVVCRAGALTVAELACVGVASVLVPFPYAVDDHQTTNAAYLSENGAAILIQQAALSVAKTSEILQQLTRKKCLTMAKHARVLAKPEATASVANVCMALAGVTV